MISNKTGRLRNVIRAVGCLAGIFISVLMAVRCYGDPPSPPSFKVIRVKNLADDAKVESLLETSDPSDSNSRYKIGSVEKQRDGKEWLMVNGQKVFEGYSLSPACSASDGTIVVSSFSDLHNQMNGDGSQFVVDKKTSKFTITTSSIWIIDASGAKRKITPDTMHATHPVISRDGHWLAYTGQALNDKGVPSDQQVYVVSVQNGVASAPVSLNLQSKGEIIPVKWDRGDQLVVLTTEDENSSTYQLTWVRMGMGS